MKMKLILLCLIIVAGCQKDKNPFRPIDPDFGIYLLKDKNIKIDQISNTNINHLELDPTPWLTSADIIFYDLSSHYFYLNANNNELFTRGKTINWDRQPFIVYANNQRCYPGCFQTSYSSLHVISPYIDDISLQLFPTDILAIQCGNPTHDQRNDENVIIELSAQNKLHQGLSLVLKDVTILTNSDSAVVQYTYSIKNIDTDHLYVLDPDKMGSNLFHYYCIGPSFQNSQASVASNYRKVEKPKLNNLWKAEWFTQIKSGAVIDRTVVLTGYPHISSGIYTTSIHFFSPFDIAKPDRETADGRYWLGRLDAETQKIVSE